MRKTFLLISQCIILVLAMLLTLGFLLTATCFLWLCDHQVKTVPSNITQLLSRFYSTTFIHTQFENLTIQLDNKNNIIITSPILLKNNNNQNILDASNASVIIYPTKITNYRIPIDLRIDNLNIHTAHFDFPETFFSQYLAKMELNKKFPIFKINNMAVHNSKIITPYCEYLLNHDFNFNIPLKALKIPCTDSNKKDILISQSEITTQNDIIRKISINNVPLNILNQIIPKSYRPKILNQSSSLVNIEFFTSQNSQDVRFAINSSASDKVVNHISIKGEKKYHLPLNIDFLINLKNNYGYFQGNMEFTLLKNLLFHKEIKLILKAEVENIDLQNLDNLWPETLEEQTREWLVTSFIAGKMNKASIKLNIQDIYNIKPDDLDVYLTFRDLHLNYFHAHKPVTNASGNAHFNFERVKINIDKSNLGTANLKNSTVIIKFLDPDIPLTIDTLSYGHLSNFIPFLQSDKKNTILTKNIDLTTITSIADFKCHILIPLAKNLSLENSQLSLKGQLLNVALNLHNNLHIKSKHLNINITNHTVSVGGKIDINGQNSELSLISNLIKKDQFENQITLTTSIFKDSPLLKSIPPILVLKEGVILGNFSYMNTENTEEIKLHLNMDNSSFEINDFAISKTLQGDAKVDVELESQHQGNWKSKNISFCSKSNKINISADIELSNNFDKILSLTSEVQFPNNNLNYSFSQKDNKKSISLRSISLDLSQTNLFEILNFFIKDQSTASNEMSFSLQLDNIKMKNNIYFKNIIGNFDCKKGSCSNSGLSMTMNDNTQLNIKLLNKQNKNFWIIKTNNASYFLKGLNIYKNINGGDLTITLKDITPLKNQISVFSGNFKMNNFSAIKTPLLTKLIILSPFSSLIKTIEGKDLLPFTTMEGNFTTEDQLMKIEHAFATGQYLTATLKGVINYKKGTIDLKGRIIPKSLLNSMFNQQSEQEKGKALLSTKYRIVGKITEPEVLVHPIGALLSIITSIPFRIL